MTVPTLLTVFVFLIRWIVVAPQQQQQQSPEIVCLPNGGRCDTHSQCPIWRDQGECTTSRTYMNQYCPASCWQERQETKKDNKKQQQQRKLGNNNKHTNKKMYTTTKTIPCVDRHEHCREWAKEGECEENEQPMKEYCPVACNYCEDGDDELVIEVDVELEERDDHPKCLDRELRCPYWASVGECQKNPNYMELHCAQSCGTCDKAVPQIQRRRQQEVQNLYDDNVDPQALERLLDLSETFGVRQTANGMQREETLEVIQKAATYMETKRQEIESGASSLPAKVISECLNRHDMCSFWALIGECDKNKAYMNTNCAPACNSCHLIDFETRCPPLENPKPALRPGDLNKMFERIVATAPGNRTLTEAERQDLEAQGMTEYTVFVYSRPSNEPATEVSIATDKSLPPWVIILDNFITDEEAASLIRLGYKYEYKRSEDVGAAKFDGSHDSVQSSRRTSENAWCSGLHGCRQEEVPARIHERMSKVMNIDAVNSEDLQILKYEQGQFYRTHHDFIPHQVDRQCGPRILTFFLYLSDVEDGGGTNFPTLDITVQPKKGRALLWPSVYDADPTVSDHRM